ncbi:hypothetical protein V8G54_029690 [Vigna mungo]|uniref:Uncharacterized protein n=1 Tax=Vigna mungo TaxID=3915 RepID=A0AAQ3MTV6_VIGMU
MEITNYGEIQSDITLLIASSNTIKEIFIMQTQIQTNPRVPPQKTGKSFRHNDASGIEDYQHLDAEIRYFCTVFQSKLAGFRRETRVVAETVTRTTFKLSSNALFVVSFSST